MKLTVVGGGGFRVPLVYGALLEKAERLGLDEVVLHDIDETRELVPGQNATTLQVAASVLGAVFWMIRNPRRGFNVPDDLPHDKVLEVANTYLGPCPSVQSDWTPLRDRVDLFAKWGGAARPADDDVWQFGSFLA